MTITKFSSQEDPKSGAYRVKLELYCSVEEQEKLHKLFLNYLQRQAAFKF